MPAERERRTEYRTEYRYETVSGPADAPRHSGGIFLLAGPPDLPRAAQNIGAVLPSDVMLTAVYLES